MNRRRFLLCGGAGAAALLLAAGGRGALLVRRHYLRAALSDRLLSEALPPLTAIGLRELQTLPGRAREAIRVYFQGRGISVEGFVAGLCSDAFRQRLAACRAPAEREDCVQLAFCDRVAPASEMVNRVGVIAADIGSELDLHWASYCRELAGRWNVRLHGYGDPLGADALTAQLGSLIEAELRSAVQHAAAAAADQGPALGTTLRQVGESAILLLPLARSGGLAVPLFFLLAARPVWEFIASRLQDRRAGFQAEVSGRLALLGNQVGAELESKVRRRLAALHAWQDQAVHALTERLVAERVGLV
jgi:hypothetical protein